MKKALCFFATEKGYTALHTALRAGMAERIACVVTFPEIEMQSVWHHRIETLCAQAGIPFRWWRDVRADLSLLARQFDAAAAIAVSWRYMLPLRLNADLICPIIVFHDSMLPQYRGFAPTPTAIMCGERTLGVTALFASDSVDAGDIIFQYPMEVGTNEYIADIISRQAAIYGKMFVELLGQIENGTITAVSQDETLATYSLWRSPDDCHINWQCSAKEIFDLIRACGPPYPGAYTMYNGQKIIVLRACVKADIFFALRDTGKIWELATHGPLVVCGSGMLQITQAVDESGEAVTFNKLRVRLQ